MKPHPGRLELEDDPGLGVQIKYKDTVHEIYGLCFLDEAAKKGKHTELTCTCVDGWCEELCFPKIHVMMREDEHKCLLALGVQTKRDINLKAQDAFEKQDARAMVDAYYELRLWDGTFRNVNNRNALWDFHIKYEKKLHTVSLVFGEAAKTATMRMKCDCDEARCGKLCYPKIHVMMREDEDRCLQALGLQSEQETNLKKLEQIRFELVQNSSRLEKVIDRARTRAVTTKNVEFIGRLNAKMVEWHAHVSGLVEWHTHVSTSLLVEAYTPHAREATATSSVNSASASPSTHRVESASGDDASSHSTGRLKPGQPAVGLPGNIPARPPIDRVENALDAERRPRKKPKTTRESREALQVIATNVPVI